VASGAPEQRKAAELIEAELKARVADPDALRARLGRLAAGETSIYRDTYYDHPGRDLTARGRELRVREMETGGVRRALLTCKEPSADAASGSKPEHETKVADASVADFILRAIGMERLVWFEKHCVNYRFTARGRDMLATIVTVPEIDGTFIELETMATEAELAAALSDVRAVVGELGITQDDLTTETYTDAVMRARA
jgi:adenylate cyclase, class 2